MKTRLDIRIPDEELAVLESFCKQSERTKSDVIRELIRSLKRKLKEPPKS